MFRPLLYRTLFLSIVLRFSFFVANKYDLFFNVWWFDIPMHFVGGVVLVALPVWFFGSIRNRFLNIKTSSVWAFSLAFVLLIGLLWEVYEYMTGHTFNTIGSYPLDIVKDLVMAIAGAVLVLVYYTRSLLVLHD